MPINCDYIAYKSTGYFSRIITDYLDGSENIKPLIAHPPTIEGISAAIANRINAPSHRELLVSELRQQYNGLPLSALQQENLAKLSQDTTFTICTAHQPNIFTGHLYFIYKILHTIKLAQELGRQMPQYHFVPFYYMGSEDADLEELGHINLNGEKLEWKTNQTGAVGRMKVDKHLIALIERIYGELGVLPFGNELSELLRSAYQEGVTIQQATLVLVNQLFGEYGLLVLIPDNANLKRPFNPIVKRELTAQFSHPLVESTAKKLGENYKVQASGRDINLFYLDDGARDRIVFEEGVFRVPGKVWMTEQVLEELESHPERFSANVILRGLFQEMILPNIAFIGGGGEVAYWLELKAVFDAADVPYPVLLLRNSFVLVDKTSRDTVSKLGFSLPEFFAPQDVLVEKHVRRSSGLQLSLEQEREQFRDSYKHIQDVAAKVDPTLLAHVGALQSELDKKFIALEKKMLRAEKRKFESATRQIQWVKSTLFPRNNLQERVDNLSPWYARYGKQLFDELLACSQTTAQEFGIARLAD
ncbi:bacillithiol biosynthesis cysteine-adding enzyme BshC [Segetibacter sp. 3557_3]|uniref:bacillithiol biosynthesis cysteine-adding enzyme BshC n=1 Tax=Segetibacter sp. 3557_3 TaxID=2547429 RepID=UPI00105885CB|nr:bacillithiol biosynthesis cysteine-adding enzyme BshC [Segetibacter sp. 3557_3]TDH27425.1 bacillithiol biosynthesis cysteine-adding enzyme BshC [Segetibacter sp. 3557_3]